MTTWKPALAATTEPLFCEIRDSFGDVESAALVETPHEAFCWYAEHGINFDEIEWNHSQEIYSVFRHA